MIYTRRRFLETAGAGLAAAGVGSWIGCSGSAPPAVEFEGAPGVELATPGAALPDYSHDLERYLVRLSGEARARRRQIVSAVTTRQQVLDRQKAVVDQLWTLLGARPERTPLTPRVTGVIDRDGYRVEKVIFESRPQLFVTANLYVPARTGRRPAILGPLGHSVNGKAAATYQRLFSNLARKGYVVLAYDPFGQGERIEYPGARPGQSMLGSGATVEHEYAGRRLILLGANFGLFRAWDGIRGVDYLLTRPEVDPERIGCCGQSGGGTLTQFIAGLDDRIQAAVVSQGNTENLAREDVEPPGSVADAEQNIVPGLAHGIDRADLLYPFAPRPLLITVTLHDAGHTYSPAYIDGSLELLAEYRHAYGLLDAADRVAVQATTQRHGYDYEMRRATYGWFNRWLGVSDADDEEPSQAIEPDEALFVTPTGFVATSFGGETALSLTRQMADRVTTPAPAGAADARARVRQVLAIDSLPDEPPAARVLSRIRKRGYHAEQFEIASEREIRTPGWLLTPDDADPSTPTLLYLGEAPAWTSVAEGALAERLCAEGRCRVAIVDVRGRGDCALAYPPRGRFYFTNRIQEESWVTWFTLWLGRPLAGGQVYDAMRTLAYLRSRPEAAVRPILLIGDGPHGVVALYAAALDERAGGVALRRTVTDYRSLAVAERYTQPFGIYAYGLLREFDLPQVAGALGPRPVLLLDPVGPTGAPAGPAARPLYASAPNVTVQLSGVGEDAARRLAAWASA